MINALFITLLPTLFFLILFPKIGIHIKSSYLRFSFAWLTGLCFFTCIAFFLAIGLSTITTNLLAKSVFITLLLTELSLFFFAKDIGNFTILYWRKLNNYKSLDIILVSLCLLFALAFYLPQLQMQQTTIYTSPIYWDFHWHATLIQNFVYGDNFPVQNEAFGGVTHTYHYLWGIATAMYVTCGLSLVDAINTISILGLFFLLLSILGISEEFFSSKIPGIFAILFTLTSSSLHFLYFLNPDTTTFITTILQTTNHPFATSFIKGNAFGYQGIMFNMFYFLEERQLLLGCLYLICCTWLLFNIERFTKKMLFLLGACMGAFFLWHLYLTIMILCALCFLLIFSPYKKNILIMLSGFFIIFSLHALYLHHVLSNSPWIYSTISQYPRFNFTFAKGNGHAISLGQFFSFYIFSYGIKLLFIYLGAKQLLKNNKQIFLILASIIIPSFILVNAIQLSPADISENHKWIRPLNILLDLVAAYAFSHYFFVRRERKNLIFAFLSFLLLTTSGLIEIYPFMNTRPIITYAQFPSPLTQALQTHTPPKAVVMGFDTNEIGLAGRKVFAGFPLGGDMNLKMNERKNIIASIYTAGDKKTFCHITQKNPIDFVEYDNDFPALFVRDATTTSFATKNNENQTVKFIDVSKFCKNI